MSDLEKIKKLAREDEKFSKSFSGVTSVVEAINVAKSKGFNISKEDVLNDKELNEELLVAAAGGKGNKTVQQNTYSQNTTNVVNGDNNNIYSDHHGSIDSNITNH